MRLTFAVENLVAPKTLEPLQIDGERLITASGKVIPFYRGVPIFLNSVEITPHQRSELENHTIYVQHIREGKNPQFSPNQPHRQTKNCYSWAEAWINPSTVNENTRVICIGGAFADDLPHVTSQFKFNVDHLAHAYLDIVPEILESGSQFIAATAEQLPFPTNYADIIYSRNALDHVCNPIEAVTEAYRVLKPNGLFFLGVYYNSTFLDEHESTVVESEFLERCIRPLFEIQSCIVKDVPTQRSIGSGRTGFLYLVCEKKPGQRLNFSGEQIATVGTILKGFHTALYEEERGRWRAALPCFDEVVCCEPVFRTDVWRVLYSLIRVSAARHPDFFLELSTLLSHAIPDPFWLETIASSAGCHGIQLESRELHSQSLRLPGIFERGRLLSYLALAAFECGSLDGYGAAITKLWELR